MHGTRPKLASFTFLSSLALFLFNPSSALGDEKDQQIHDGVPIRAEDSQETPSPTTIDFSEKHKPYCMRETAIMTMENDYFAGDDDHYTSGWRVTWITDKLDCYAEDYVFKGLVDTFSFLPFVGNEGYRHHFTMSFGQVIMTPDETDLRDPLPNTQPYAGLLYLSAGLIAHSDRSMHKYEVLGGATGKLSLAEETQRLLHNLFGADDVKGWDHQIHTEPVLNLNYQFNYRLHEAELGKGWSLDLIPSMAAKLGNLRISTNAGALVRVGVHMPKAFGPGIIKTGVESNVVWIEEPRNGWSLDFHAGIDGELVGRDLFLDGNTFKDYDRDVDKESFVGSYFGGVNFQYGRWGGSINFLYSTDTFKDQHGNNKYGSLSLNYRW
jgi:hypothetical protein